VDVARVRQEIFMKLKRAFIQLLVVGGVALLAWFGTAAWNIGYRTPVYNRLPLPDTLIAADSAAGHKLFVDSRYTADYDDLYRNFVSQEHMAFCGVASSVTVLNALHMSPPVSQKTFFDDAASKVHGELAVRFGGMTLEQLSGLLRAHGVEATATFASDTTLEKFRELAKENLKTHGDYMLINYQRGKLGQRESGHISPLAAYDAASDRFLILDVAAFKYPPVWVPAATLWAAMQAVDSSSGRSRGFVVVRAGSAAARQP
jgi:hypothetical protein